MHPHTRENRIIGHWTGSLEQNIQTYETLIEGCNDIVKYAMDLAGDGGFRVYISYIDVMINRNIIEQQLMEQFLNYRRFTELAKNTGEDFITYLKRTGIAVADIRTERTVDAAVNAVLSGDSMMLVDGSDQAIIIGTRAWPNRGVGEAQTEKVVRGPKEAFTETIRFNTVLIRRRIRDTRLKVKQKQLGTRSRTDAAILYMEDLVRPEVLHELERRLEIYSIDAVLETGTIEQLIEDKWYSPFPQMQCTERPDKAASALLEGRIVLAIDTTPYVLILPSTLNTFMQASEDYYNRWAVSAMIRFLRYVAMFLAMCTPGLYIALTTFHPAMLPSSLIFSIAASRDGVPFYATIEVIIMEIAFEMLREAGLRLPSAVGHTVSVVGGLIIGQAAVEAGIASPIVVIIVSLTAIASFVIPNEGFVSAIRLCKYIIIAASALLGLYGFMLAVLGILVHLSGLKSFGIPYLSPFSFWGVNEGEDRKDSLLRAPIAAMRKRPVYSRDGCRIRLVKRGKRDGK